MRFLALIAIGAVLTELHVAHARVGLAGAALNRDHQLLDSQRRDSPFSPAWYPGRRASPPLQRRSESATVATPRRDTTVSQTTQTAPMSNTAAPSSTNPTLLQLAFMHRHGARTAPVVINGLLSWHWCHLSQEGTVMAVKLGQYLRQRYGSFLGDVYDSRRFVSRSTQYERTIRTGYGAVTGAFPRSSPNNNFSIPYLYHVDMDSDKALSYYYSWGSAMLHQVELNAYNGNTAEQTLSYFPLTMLQQLGAIVDASPECATAADATSCALLLEDVTTCSWSNGPNVSQTLLDALNDQYLFRAQAESLRFIYAFNASSPYSLGAGPYGMRILTDILAQFRAALQPGADAPPVFHYSAHDVTLFGLFVALGAIDVSTKDYSALVPSFTAAAFFELYSNASVTVAYATMQQPYGSPHDYSVDPRLQLRCINTDGNEYRSSNCPIDDWARFLATLNVSTLSDPTCFALPSDVAATRCEPWGTTSISDLANMSLSDSERTLRSYCITYRQFCPDTACNINLVQPPAGLPSNVDSSDRYVLNRVSWSCLRAQNVVPAGSANGRPPVTLVAIFLALGGVTTMALLVVSILECLGVHKKVAAGEGAPVEETTDLMGGEERFRSSVGRARDNTPRTPQEEPFVSKKPGEDQDLYAEP